MESAQSTPPTLIVHVAASICASYCSINVPSLVPASQAADIIHWIPPASKWVKLNFDGSVISTSSVVEFVIRDSFGVPLVAGTCRLYTSNVPIAECCALIDFLDAAKMFNFKSIVAERDSLLTINCNNNACEVLWHLKSHIHDVVHVTSDEFDNINFLVDALANLKHDFHLQIKIWLGALSPQAA
ncbi:hypothetical protein ACLB2K_040544 [Fragaria x ananassa]